MKALTFPLEHCEDMKTEKEKKLFRQNIGQGYILLSAGSIIIAINIYPDWFV